MFDCFLVLVESLINDMCKNTK